MAEHIHASCRYRYEIANPMQGVAGRPMALAKLVLDLRTGGH
jgi:hypothetical protein